MRALAILLALAGWATSAVAMLAGLFWGLGLRCDDSCGGQGWRRTYDAWQWYGVAALGVATFLAATAFVVFVWLGRGVWATLAFGSALVALGSLATALSPEWTEHLGRRGSGQTLLLVVGLGAPLLAVLLTRPRPRRAAP